MTEPEPSGLAVSLARLEVKLDNVIAVQKDHNRYIEALKARRFPTSQVITGISSTVATIAAIVALVRH
jgi:hypothetical protein